MRYHQIVQVWGVLLPVETLYMKLLGRAMFSLPYLVLLQDNSTTAYWQYFVLDTHLIDKLVLLLGILKLVFCNGRFHVVQKGTRIIGVEMDRQRTRTLISYSYATRSSACKVDSHAQNHPE